MATDLICHHEQDDLGYPVSNNMCDACKALSKRMNDWYLHCVNNLGYDPDRQFPRTDEVEA